MNVTELTPFLELNNGVNMPQVGLGVFKMDDEQAEEATRYAIDVAGYRAIDTAAVYGNEAGVGRAIAASKVDREDLFITTKLWNDNQGYDETLQAFEESMKKLDLSYLDLYLIHWPKPQLDKALDTWRAFERLYDEGLIRAIGVSNFKPHHLDALLAQANIIPAVNQIELHPMMSQIETREYCEQREIKIEAWSPLMQAGELLDHPVIQGIANVHSKEPAQVVLRWHVQSGFLVIPKSKTPERIKDNIEIFTFELSPEEMLQIDSLNSNRRIGPDPDKL